MIIGIGIDIIELHRIEKILEKNPDSFLGRIFTPEELKDLPASGKRRVEYVAGRFAVKEAAAKALGTGIGKTFSFLDGEIRKNDEGKPVLTISAETLGKLNLSPSLLAHVSISHSRDYAIAQVVLETM